MILTPTNGDIIFRPRYDTARHGSSLSGLEKSRSSSSGTDGRWHSLTVVYFYRISHSPGAISTEMHSHANLAECRRRTRSGRKIASDSPPSSRVSHTTHTTFARPRSLRSLTHGFFGRSFGSFVSGRRFVSTPMISAIFHGMHNNKQHS